MPEPLVRPSLATSYWSRTRPMWVAACRLSTEQFSLNIIICFDFHRGKFLRLIVYSSVFLLSSVEETIPCDSWPWIQWLMPSPQLLLIWVSENGVQTSCCGQVKFSVLRPCMSATKAKTLWSLTSCLPTALRVIIRFLWANSVMRATESGTSYSSFLWSSTQWSFWKSESLVRAGTTSGHCTQRHSQQTKSTLARTLSTT
jgi:hypothetical protein